MCSEFFGQNRSHSHTHTHAVRRQCSCRIVSSGYVGYGHAAIGKNGNMAKRTQKFDNTCNALAQRSMALAKMPYGLRRGGGRQICLLNCALVVCVQQHNSVFQWKAKVLQWWCSGFIRHTALFNDRLSLKSINYKFVRTKWPIHTITPHGQKWKWDRAVEIKRTREQKCTLSVYFRTLPTHTKNREFISATNNKKNRDGVERWWARATVNNHA